MNINFSPRINITIVGDWKPLAPLLILLLKLHGYI